MIKCVRSRKNAHSSGCQRGKQDILLSDQQLCGRSFDRNVSCHTASTRVLRAMAHLMGRIKLLSAAGSKKALFT